ncbi:molybdopterin molybdenumtransferase MoeA [Betaproteobacteria bacterium GR16-43]|nr:molybdopterin molybdenumtransferase MoeA [Betaproteobacteria bacterium GR16-43]
MPPLTIAQASCADDYDPNSMPVAKARAFIFQFLEPVQATVRLPIRDALGRVLAEDIVTPLDVPSHRNSAMDGWALRGADLAAEGETTLTEIGASFAGRPFGGSVGAGECVRIMTGGVVPEGSDTVVMQERSRVDGKRIAFAPGQKTGQNVREAGEDLAKGSVALTRGRRIRPAELGLIASLGIGEVRVYRTLRVAFFSTGDELKGIGTPLGAGEIYDSNRYTLHGMLKRLGCDVLDLGVIPDDPPAIERAFREAAASADVVITSGGVSVGEADFVKPMLAKLGEVVFWKIAMKPGRPLAYGKIGDAHFFGLPGNPVSVMATFYQFVRDALLVLMGANPVEPVPTFRATCTVKLKKAPGRTEFQRGILSRGTDGLWTVRPTGEQGSGILKSMSDANCFIILGDAVGNVEAGTTVEVQLLEGVV